MISLRAAVLLAAVPAVVLLSGRFTLGEMSGDRGRPIVMQGTLPGDAGGDRARLSIEIERVGFMLNTVQGRYRLARLRFEHIGTTPVALSVERDTLEADAGAGGPVAAVLNLQSGDSPFWDALSPDMRQILAYPRTIKARPAGPGSAAEVIYVYALFPADKVNEVPRSFTYRIDSLGEPVRIAQRAAAALH